MVVDLDLVEVQSFSYTLSSIIYTASRTHLLTTETACYKGLDIFMPMTIVTKKHICIRSTLRARGWLNTRKGSLIQPLNFVSHLVSDGSGVSKSSLNLFMKWDTV